MKNKKMFRNWFVLLFTIVSLATGILLTEKSAEGYAGYTGACRTSCNDNTGLGCSLRCGGCGCYYTDDKMEISDTIDKGTCIVKYTATSADPAKCNPINFYDTDCDDGATACSEDKCPNGSFENGASCTVTLGHSSGSGGTAVCNIREVTTEHGKWDASQKKCVLCTGLKEGRICADTGSIRLSAITRVCDPGELGGLTFETACSTAVDSSCDDKAENSVCATGKVCNALGACIALPVDSMNLKIKASDNPIEINDTTTVTFTTKKTDGTNIDGATVTVTSISCGALPNPGSTTSSGETTSTFIAPGGAGNCTINATATHADYDNATATYIISVQSADCFNDYRVWFDDDDYIVGDTLQLLGVVFAGGDDSIVCLYREGTERDSEILNAGAFPSDLDFVNVTAGTWQGGLFKNILSCGAYDDADCQTEVIVVSDGGGPGGPCVPAITCSSDLWSACSSAQQSRSCDDGCGGTVTQTRSCCLTDDDCANPNPVCDTTIEQCVACLVSGDCLDSEICSTVTGVSTDNFCTPCTGEGIDAGDASLCCFGLSYLDIDGDGIFVCTSACDPSAWFFCNPLRGTVENITQAGETMLGYILGLIGSISLLFIIIAGMMYMTSAGNEERITSSKKVLTGAVIGLMIALLAYGMLQVIMEVLNMV